jgi:hypothetical protein
MPRIAVALIPIAAVALSNPAVAIGFGIEGGGTFTQTSGLPNPNGYGVGNAGFIVENNFPVGALFLDLWADIQTPFLLHSGLTGGDLLGEATPWYVPIDLGLRLGLNFGLPRPYIGILGQTAILVFDQHLSGLSNPLWGLGGDLGLDLAVGIFRLGIEFRGVETLTGIESEPSYYGTATPHGSAFEFEGLASARLSF